MDTSCKPKKSAKLLSLWGEKQNPVIHNSKTGKENRAMIIFKHIIRPIINTTTTVVEPEELIPDKVIFFYANDIKEAEEKRMKYLESMEMYFREYISDLVEVCDSRSTATYGCC